MIACRLKIGGRDMSEKAVDDAKKVRFFAITHHDHADDFKSDSGGGD